MRPLRSDALREDIPAWLAGAAAVCALISIAAMEIFMGAAVVALLITRTRWRIPRLWLPLALFALLTLISLAASGQIREGLPQVKKFFLYLMLFLIPSALRNIRQVRMLAMGWAVAAAASSAWALNQFYNKYEDAVDAHRNFYRAYANNRITGFMDHWMTFSNLTMMALLIVAAIVFFSSDRSNPTREGGDSRRKETDPSVPSQHLDISQKPRRGRSGLSPFSSNVLGMAWLMGAGVLILIALILNETRSVWLATAIGGAYLIWFWRPWLLILLPIVIAVLVLANPFEIRDRLLSPFRPHGNLDSTAHRAELRRIGWQMIKAHPWVGVGPEQVWRQAKSYMPPGVETLQPSEYYGHLENDYVQYAAERGVPAMLALMWMIGWALLDFVRGLRSLSRASTLPGGDCQTGPGPRLRPGADAKWVLHAAVAVIVSVLVAGWFSWNLNASTVLGMFLAVIGCGYVALMESGPVASSPARKGGDH
jgi:putative inorganic carbon (hco3(-)) transporter